MTLETRLNGNERQSPAGAETAPTTPVPAGQTVFSVFPQVSGELSRDGESNPGPIHYERALVPQHLVARKRHSPAETPLLARQSPYRIRTL